MCKANEELRCVDQIHCVAIEPPTPSTTSRTSCVWLTELRVQKSRVGVGRRREIKNEAEEIGKI